MPIPRPKNMTVAEIDDCLIEMTATVQAWRQHGDTGGVNVIDAYTLIDELLDLRLEITARQPIAA